MTITQETAKKKKRIAISLKPQFIDHKAEQILREITQHLFLPIEKLRIIRIYTIHKNLSDEQVQAIADGPLTDPIIEELVDADDHCHDFNWTVEVSFKKGMTDNAAMTAQLTIEDFFNEEFAPGERVAYSTQYKLKGKVDRTDIERIATELLANSVIEEINISESSPSALYEAVDVNIDDNALLQLSKNRQLALNLEEMQAIKHYFSSNGITASRKRLSLPKVPTDVELEAIAQTWSEHCKHKIFNATIHYKENGKSETIASLFKSFIKASTDALLEKKEWLVSVFSDNAGIINFNEKYNIAFKVETHNSPSALDPYGGALTGILGVNRDIMGAGMGARLLANTDVFCFAPPDYAGELPERLMHPKRIMEGVRRGVEHGGNKSGVPTINGALVFDERYLGKPLVYCGTVGILPREIAGVKTEEKSISPGDLIVVAGGKTGRDGIHGATFSSEELHATSPASAVQIGDPFTQKKLHDFIIEARDKLLFRTLTDNGAGGFSSSVGELAELSGGAELHLDQAPIKALDLQPWEILVSESQERMTLAVPQEKIDALQALAALHEVGIAVIGRFTDSGAFHVLYDNTTVAFLNLDFLHNGLPEMHLEAEWENKPINTDNCPKTSDYTDVLKKILSGLNVCSKEAIIRQYDHEVQGGSVLKPLTGLHNDGPSDAAIVCPIEEMESPEKIRSGIVLSNGICPKYSDLDCYEMAASAIDEAIRNSIAVGANPSHLAILDNFCWPDPIYHSNKTPDGKLKLAQLVRANKALFDMSQAFEVPIISGKDSMKNDYKIGNTKISVPPTLLISAVAKIDNVEKAVSMDVKMAGDYLYILGLTKNEMGGSEYAKHHSYSKGQAPTVDPHQAKILYLQLHRAMQNELIASCHDCSDGGLAAALAESAFSGGLGVSCSLHHVPTEEPLEETVLLFSESNSRFIVTVAVDKAKQFEELFTTLPVAKIGSVRSDERFIITGKNKNELINESIFSLKAAWQYPLQAGGCLK